MARASQSKYLQVLSLEDYLKDYRRDPDKQTNVAGRILRAIGEPRTVNSKEADSRFQIIYPGREVPIYDVFADFHGLEQQIHGFVLYLKNAAKGLIEDRKVFYITGAVSSGKTRFIERVKRLSTKFPIVVLGYKEKDAVELSPALESPLSIFDFDDDGPHLVEKFGIPQWRLSAPPSPWAAERLEDDGNRDKFVAVKIKPSIALNTAVMRVDLGSAAHDDLSGLIGRHKKEGYEYTGGFNRTTQGVLEVFEMFKASDAQLHPLLSLTEKRYAAHGGFGDLPYEGLVIAGSNPHEWLEFSKYVAKNAAHLDRMHVVKWPYNVRLTDQIRLFEQYLREGGNTDLPKTPGALELLAEFAVRSRLHTGTRVPIDEKIRAYDGYPYLEKKYLDFTTDNLRADVSGLDGMGGVSERFNQEILSAASQEDPHEAGLDAVLLYTVLDRKVELIEADEANVADSQHEDQDSLSEILHNVIRPRLLDLVVTTVRQAIAENREAYIEAKITRFAELADKWLEEEEYFDLDKEGRMGREEIHAELFRTEKGMGIQSPKVYRILLQKALLHYRAKQHPEQSFVKGLEKTVRDPFETYLLREIESQTSDEEKKAPPIYDLSPRKSVVLQQAHDDFMVRVCASGYTKRQAQRLVVEYSKHVIQLEKNK